VIRVLYFIGLGLYDEKDISLKGIETLKKVDTVYAEFYTAKLFGTSISSLENLIGTKIKILSRKEVEEDDIPLNDAKDRNVAFLSSGDPMIATTHSNMMIEAKKRGISIKVIHGSSILSAAPGISGLQVYKFGKITTIPFSDDKYHPHSPYLKIKKNLEFNAHSLVLLDIKVDEGRYMSANEGLKYLLNVEKERKENIIFDHTLAVVIARAGSKNPKIRADKIKILLNEDFGGPLHTLIIPSKLHFLEAESLVIIGGAPEELLDEYMSYGH
jgi:diphthine synthase